MDRRSFLLGGLSALVALSTPKLVDNGVEMVARAEAREPKKTQISEQEFNRLMAYNTVDDILREYNIGSVDDNSYKRKVYDSDKHVMVLFYDNCGRGAKGLGLLFGLLSKKFASKFNVYGYKMSEECEHTPRSVFVHVTKTYDFKDTPAILFYKNSDDMINKLGALTGGVITYDNFQRLEQKTSKEIREEVLK